MTTAALSVLDSTKKILGIAPEYKAFDLDIVTHINSVFSTLQELGVGPTDGFMIEDESAVWGDYLGPDKRLNQVRTYVSMRVRLMFDLPATSFAINAMQEQVKEMEWRLMVAVDPIFVVLPESDDVFGNPIILDGGGA